MPGSSPPQTRRRPAEWIKLWIRLRRTSGCQKIERERERERLAGLDLYLKEELDSVEGRGGRPRGGTGYPSSDEHLRRVGGSAHPPSTRSAASQWLPSLHRPLPSLSLARSLLSLPVPESVRLRLEKSGKVVSRARAIILPSKNSACLNRAARARARSSGGRRGQGPLAGGRTRSLGRRRG